VLVDGEEQLWNFGFRVDFQFLFDVVWLADEAYVACDVVFYHVGLSRNRKFKAEKDLVGASFLFLQLRVHVEKKLLFRKVLADSFSV
jgi:hypothetical protein